MRVDVLVEAKSEAEARDKIANTLETLTKDWGFTHKQGQCECVRYYPATANPSLVIDYRDALEHEEECACCNGTCECKNRQHACFDRKAAGELFDMIFESVV